MTLDALDRRVEGYDLGGGLRFPGFSETFNQTIELPEVRRHRYHRRGQHVFL